MAINIVDVPEQHDNLSTSGMSMAFQAIVRHANLCVHSCAPMCMHVCGCTPYVGAGVSV